MEATWPSKSNVRLLNGLLNSAISKIFDVKDKTNIEFIREMCELPNLYTVIEQRKYVNIKSKFRFVDIS